MIEMIAEKLKVYKRKILDDPGCKRAAVLIPIIEKQGEIAIIFTKRTEKLEVHKGQVSFPGGHVDEVDKTMEDTALRETEEEIGINRKQVEILGVTDDSNTTTGYLVTPYVGLIRNPINYKIEENEIERVIEVPLKYLKDPKNWQKEEYNYKGRIWHGLFCIYKGDKIWGATAKILQRFLEIVS
jgi:8-oxo-dGTP pyrophosphatase MutT (NUDIX family)